MSIEKENSMMKNSIELCFVAEKVEKKIRHLGIFLYNEIH